MATLRQLLETAITTNSVTGMIPKEIRKKLVEQSRVMNPLYGIISREKTENIVHFWVRRIGLPNGGFTSQAPNFSGTGSLPETASNYVNNNHMNVRYLTWRGNLAKVAEQVATVTGSLIAKEMAGQAESAARTEAVASFYGHESGTINSLHTEFSGMDTLISPANKFTTFAIDGNAFHIMALNYLDAMYDTLRSKMGIPTLGGKFIWLMSPEMQTVINNLYFNLNRVNLPIDGKLNPQISDDLFGTKDQEYFAAMVKAMVGPTVASYRDVPILVTSFLTPFSPTATWTITGTTQAGASNFTDGTTVFKYVLEAVTQLGKTISSAEVSVTAGNTTNQNKLTWTTPTILDANNNSLPIMHYRIFRAGVNGTPGVTGAESLYAVIPALDSTDTAVTQFIDDNNAYDPLATWEANGTANTAQTSPGFGWVGKQNASDGVTLPTKLVSGYPTQDVFLWPVDPDICAMKVLNEINQQVLAPITSRSIQYETRADMGLALFSTMYAAQLSGVSTK